jgi:hypothetical protein
MTTSTSVFYSVTVTPQAVTPATPQRPKRIATQDGSLLDRGEPVVALIGPQWYFRWLGARVEEPLARAVHVPSLRRTARSSDQLVGQDLLTNPWVLCIQPPECTGLVIDVYPESANSLARPRNLGVWQYEAPDRIAWARPQIWPVIEESVEAVESWPMSQGPVIFNSGAVFYSVRNTSDRDQTLIMLSSSRRSDLEELLADPSVGIARP